MYAILIYVYHSHDEVLCICDIEKDAVDLIDKLKSAENKEECLKVLIDIFPQENIQYMSDIIDSWYDDIDTSTRLSNIHYKYIPYIQSNMKENVDVCGDDNDVVRTATVRTTILRSKDGLKLPSIKMTDVTKQVQNILNTEIPRENVISINYVTSPDGIHNNGHIYAVITYISTQAN